jgi:hypothetical protein
VVVRVALASRPAAHAPSIPLAHAAATHSYFTGWDEPDAILVLHNLPTRGAETEGPAASTTTTAVLFVKEQSAEEVLWDGKRRGLPEAARVVDEAFPLPYVVYTVLFPCGLGTAPCKPY